MKNEKTKIIDMHNHIGASIDGASITVRKIKSEMRGAGVGRFVVCPTNEQDYDPCYARLNGWIAKVAKRHKEIIGFGRVSPTKCGAAVDEVRRIHTLGLRGIKLHVISDSFKIQQAKSVLRACAELGLLVLCHSHHMSFTSNARHWESVFAETGATFIIAHGGKDGYRNLVRIAAKYENVFVDTSCQTLWRSAYLFDKLGPRKLLFGSDMPYSHPLFELQKWRLITSGRPLEDVLYKNACRLLDIDPATV